MRKMLFLLLLLPVVCSAQRDPKTIFDMLSGKGDLGKEIRLPELKSWDLYRYISDKKKRAGYALRITDDSTYRKIFSSFPEDSLPVIDFRSQELNVFSYCPQCLAFCYHKGDKEIEPCHRNACMYKYIWFVKDKTIAKRE